MKTLLLATVIALSPAVALAAAMPVYQTDGSQHEIFQWQMAHTLWGHLTEAQQENCLEVPPGSPPPTSYEAFAFCVASANMDTALKNMDQ